MTNVWFPDNTVLCNFAIVSRLDLLREVLDGRGRWTEAVSNEARKSASAIPQLSSLAVDGWLGDPLEIDDPTDIELIERVRRAVFGGVPNTPTRHLGEAQTCHVILHWPGYKGSIWVSDDRDALEYARFQHITTRDTPALLSEAIANGLVTAQGGFDLLQRMADLGRSIRLPMNAEALRSG